MNLNELLKSKDIKPKEKTTIIADAVLSADLAIKDVIEFASSSKDPAKATCMEAFEYATNKNPAIANNELFRFAEINLSSKAPRLKWESAKVIGNIAHLFSDNLETAISSLLENSKHDGTVVRWSVAYALTQISKMAPYSNNDFRGQLQEIYDSEEKESIKKIYMKVLKS